jgi:AAHS family 4-hydroxybenzoate transporter-like MFS transporter
MNGSQIDIAELIERNKIGGRQILLLLLCLIVVCFDGFNAQVTGYAAPALVKALHVERAALGPIASAGLFGLMLGALLLGTLGDKVGRRTIIIASAATFGLFSTLTAFAHDVTLLTVLRFVTGIGLGGAMPASIALVSEYSPLRMKGTMVTITVCGFAIGPAVGGFCAPGLLHMGGWQALFLAGGIIPLLLVPLLALLLPESTRNLLARGASPDKIAANLRRVLPASAVPTGVTFTDAQGNLPKAPVAEIFRDGRLLGTICIWIAIFMNLVGINLQTNWLPLMLGDFGYSPTAALKVTAMFHVGGSIGGLVLSRVLDRFDFTKAVPVVMLLAAVAVAAIGMVGTEKAVLMGTIFLAGLFVVGVQSVLNALSGMFYPANIRSTGAGWALGMGRLGAAVGPMIGSALGGLGLATRNLFYIEAIPFVIGAAAIYLVHLQRRGGTLSDAAIAGVRSVPE